ncbi:hypothetical protein ABEB36_005561 [Hypothenemus hampei]|uniref:Kynurenine 3-monooxygenase n=1 Tax=Hypothenemus hampei TaxID=57062 RepID=A0ABD1F2I4_HYPHA
MRNYQQDRPLTKSAIVIGGGLVGSLCVSLLAQRGYKVTLFEKRGDIRKLESANGRSINLALSHRGRQALKLIGIEDEALSHSISMKGRLLHNINGHTKSVIYDPVSNQCIYSIGRNYLNRALLDVAEKDPNVRLCFHHKLTDVDFQTGFITLKSIKSGEILQTTADLIIGADGAFSSLRSFMQKTALFNFSQNFIDHGYLELCIPPERGGKLHPNHLHIWPRRELMMIALPNLDNSWTVTLFMPFKKFESIRNSENLLHFFNDIFPDALPLIGETELKNFYFSNKPSALVSIKCNRYDMNGKFLIIGDAAHAMVPFYGQGMNAGFEDCFLLNEILNETRDDVGRTTVLFTKKRQIEANAICDLAMYNYEEMRDLVTKPSFVIRKLLDTYLAKIFPRIWIPLYNSVSFSHMPYSKCIENKHWQNQILYATFSLLILVMATLVVLLRAI